MGVFLSKDTVLNRFYKAHGNTYDYSKFIEYTGAYNKIPIICKIHGNFEQTPNEHANGQGCPTCGRTKANMSKLGTEEIFINKAILKHGSSYDYSKVKYVKSSIKVEILCNIHGAFWKTPNKHLNGQGCPKCNNANRRTQQDFINESISVHGDLYDYSKSVYLNGDKNVIIICPIHGEFTQTPYSHIKQKCKCPSCSVYGFKYKEPAILYYLKLQTVYGILYKIGITNRTIEERFSATELKIMEVLSIRAFSTGHEAFKIEQKILQENEKFLYKGHKILASNGNTELFNEDISGMVEQYFIGSTVSF